jgi:LPS-assembly protein
MLGLNSFNQVFSDEFNFNISELQITESGNIIKGVNGGIVTTKNNEIIITADNFRYNKLTTLLEAEGNVKLVDKIEDIIVKANKVFYLKDKEKIYTEGKTNILIENEYNVDGYDLTLLKNTMILSSNEKTTIIDNNSTIYKLNQFQYLINEEIVKGEKIEIITNYKKKTSDKYFFETGFINLQENKFLGKDINVVLHKSLFGDSQNDPRINAVSAYGDKFETNFEKGVFTSCKKTDKCPPWKITANNIKHDKIKKQVIYKNAWLEVYDFPVFYFPKFFHPDPSVKRQSGFLSPEFGSSQNLGDSIYIPYFYVVSEDKDITFKPRIYEDKKFLLQSEYRQKTKNSFTVADFSFVTGHDSSFTDKGDTRSHLFTKTVMDLSLNNYTSSILEIDYQKISNDNYHKVFNLESPLLLQNNDVLESIIKLDLQHEDYDLTASFEMYETLNGSNTDRYQYVLPSYIFSKNFGEENLGGSFNFNSYGDNTLSETNVLTSTLLNDLNFTSYSAFFDNGIKTNYEVQLKNVNSIGKNSTKYKNSPQSELMSAYNYNISMPLLKKNKNSNNILIPKLSFRLSPHEMKNNKNTSRRINIDNVFVSNRLGLSDSFEAGESVTLGLDFIKEKVTIKEKILEVEEYFDFKLATVFRLKEEESIPINSTLSEKTSNIFGKLNFKPNKVLSIGYDFSLTNDLNTFEYNSLDAELRYNNFSTLFNYIEERGVIGSTNVMENTTEYNFNENNSLSFSTRRNRKLDLTEYYDLVYEYKNDCLVAGIKYKKKYYNDNDIKPVEELFFSITIIPLTTFSPDKIALK